MVGKRLRWTSHLVSDVGLEELHRFAKSLGAPEKAFHNKTSKPHYDIIDTWIGKALANGAKPVNTKTIILALRGLQKTT